jgi:signal transduction histidine kinase
MDLRIFRSATAQLVGIIFTLMLLGAFIMLAVYKIQTEAELRADQQERIVTIKDDALAAYINGDLDGLQSYIATRLAEHRDPGMLLSIRDGKRIIVGNVAGLPDGQELHLGWQNRSVLLSPNGKPQHARLVISPLAGNKQLVVGHLAISEQRIGKAFEAAMAAALVTALMLSALGALLAGHVISRRARDIATTAHALGQGKLDARVPEDGSGDGFDQLRHELNQMAERIGRLVGELRMVTDSLAHDLRTPITRMQAVLARPGVELAPEVAENIEREIYALDSMLSTALEISRVEAGSNEERRKLADIAPIIEELAEIYTPFAEDQGIAISSHVVPALALVDREMLARALSNLIDNAIKYGANKVDLVLEQDAGHIHVRVRDDGPGIANDQYATALRRFGRLDDARGKPGAGLGLALVNAIAHFHGGALVLADNRPGLEATIILPRPGVHAD